MKSITETIKVGFFKKANELVSANDAIYLWKKALLANDSFMLPPGQQQSMISNINSQVPQMPQPSPVLNAFGQPSSLSPQVQSPQGQPQPYMQTTYNANLQKGPNQYSSPLEVTPNANTPVSKGIDINKSINPNGISAAGGIGSSSGSKSSLGSKPPSV